MVIKCESCGATLPYDAKLKSIKCEYCGTVCALDLLRLSMGKASESDEPAEDKLLKRAAQALERGDFEEAEELYTEYLAIDPECAKALIGRLLATLQLCTEEDIVNHETCLNEYSDFNEAMKYADEEYRRKMFGLAEQALQRSITEQKSELYYYASKMLELDAVEAIAAAQKHFLSLEDYLDSEEKAEYCAKRMNELLSASQPETPTTEPESFKGILICAVAAVLLFIFAGAFSFYTSAPAKPSSSASSRPTSTTAGQGKYLPIDYRLLAENPETYDKTYVRVAGRISSRGVGKYYFEENINSFLQIQVGGSVENPEGTYIVVEGFFESGSTFKMSNCRVVETGDAAEKEAKGYEDAWVAKRLSQTENLPIMDYMNLLLDDTTYNGQLVRITGIFDMDYTDSFQGELKSRIIRNDALIVKLQSIAYPDRQLCKENTNFVFSGIVSVIDNKIYLRDCYAEKIGDEATAVAAQAEQEWWELYEEVKVAYMATCTQRSYDELARYPEKLKGQQVEVTGTVVSNDDMYGHDRIILDMVGDGVSTIQVSYIGRTGIDEPLLLPGDTVTFYGHFGGLVNLTMNEEQKEKTLLVVSYLKK